MKTCSSCKEAKEFIDFYKDRSKKDGMVHRCKKCDSKRRKLHYLEKPEMAREAAREYRKNNEEKCRIKHHNYYLNNKKVINEKNSRHYQNNKEKALARGKRYLENPENYKRMQEYTSAYYLNNKDTIKNRTKKWREENHERYIQSLKERYENNKEHHLEQTKQYKKNNPGKVAAWNKKRDMMKIQRTPAWLTDADFKFIEKFYEESARLTKETGIIYNVDHIVPLQGKNVSGLHVPWNLQVITQKENFHKHNKFSDVD